MASKTTRRWEKPVSATQAPTAPTVITVDTILDGLNEHEKACHRQAFLHLIQSLPGTDVDINVVDGRTVRGQFYTATPFPGEEFKVVVKGAKELKNNAPISGDIEALSTVFTNFKDISTIRTAKLDLQHKSYSSEFQTDSSIKKHGDLSFLEGRELQSVSNSWLDPSTNTDLGGGSTGHWDQFEANKRLFKVTSSFDENLYTKKLDMKSMTKEQIARAERIAKEIENSASSNIHLQEERGQALERDIDEEERFSGVVRTPAIVVPAKTENAWARGSKIITQSGATTPLGGKKTSPVKGGRPVPTTEQPPQQRSEKPAMLSAPPNLPPPPLRPVPGLSKTAPVVETAPAAVAKVEESPVVVAVAETPAAAPETPAASAVETKPESSSEASAVSKKLSATAKEFKFNPSASSWTPKATVPAFVPAAQQQAFVPQTFVPQQFVPPAQPFVPATPVYAAVPQSYAPVPASPMTPGSFVPPQTPPHGAVPHGVMSSPVVSAMTPGNFNNYQQPQQLQTPVNTAVPGSNYKSPSQPPSITQSPSVGSMPVPTQPNFTPLPVYQQLPPDQNFAMQQFGVGVDPNLQLQHMASPQQVAQQWVQGAPVQTPNGMMVAAQQQGFQQQQLFPPQFMPQMANLSPEQQQQQQQFMLQQQMQQMQPVQVVINGEVQTVMQPVYNIALQQQLMQQQSQQMQMMDQQQFAQMHAQMAMMNMQMPMYMAQPGYMPQQFAQAYNPQQPQGFQQQQQQQQQGAPQQQPGANANLNNQQPGGVNQHSGNQGGGYNNNYNNNGQGQNNFRANSNTGGRGGGNKFGNNNNRDYNNRGDGNREGSHNNNRGGGGYQNRGNNSQPGTPNGGNRNNYNNRGDNNNNGSSNSNSSNNTSENAAVATVMLPSETAQATNAPAGESSK